MYNINYTCYFLSGGKYCTFCFTKYKLTFFKIKILFKCMWVCWDNSLTAQNKLYFLFIII